MKERHILNGKNILIRTQVVNALQHRNAIPRLQGYPHLASPSNIGQRVFRINHQQLRFRRHDRASAFSKPRPPTRKKRRAYNRRMKKEANERARHSPAGSKAGPRRQWMENRWQQLLTYGKDDKMLLPATREEDGIYTHEDAILEELISNTSYLTSQPTPEPVYFGHRHREFYNLVADQMDAYREAIDDKKSHHEITESDNDNLPASEPTSLLPSDKDISKTLRAHRDLHGTRQQTIGIVRALQYLLQDLGVPVSAFGEYTFTTLMTCCRTPQEGRRIFKLMRDQNHEISSYSWSILVDIHAKLGDFEGCGEVLKEMVSDGGHAPTQAAYTSLLAACYKICNDSGRNSHAVRAKAGRYGWQYWQEMRIIGIEPDAMAYGAILRLCAARGLPERALSILEDMERFEVKPTTLCFTAALKSVARSHEIANRYQRGSSRRDMKRETIAAHHGKMARQIVILAEAAEVQQDDGFTSALMLCAAAAGDSSTAKAILLASEVRKLDHLRTIGGSRPDILDGSDSSLQLESQSLSRIGEGRDDAKDEGDLSGLVVYKQPHNIEATLTFGEREYGKDTRVISAFVHSCAQALNANGLGTIWAGQENLGYLCENSLRLITTRWEPSYRDRSIPGVNSTKVGIGALRHVDEREKEYEYTPGKRKKFRGLFLDEDDLATVDDVREDDRFYSDDEDDDFHSDNIQSTQNPLDYTSPDKIDNIDTRSYDEDYDNHSENSDKFCTPLKEREVRKQIVVDIFDAETENSVDQFDKPIFGSSGIADLIPKNDVISPVKSNQKCNSGSVDPLATLDPVQISKIEDLQRVLPGMPLRRLKKVLNAYDQTLGHPSMLLLVPLLRETMPDRISSGWLKRSNRENADFALHKASEDGIIDSPLLNSMLQLKANAGSLNEAIDYHQEQFAKHHLTPSAYSDRLLIQMLITNKRLSRALAFKGKIEEEGRNLDIASYGSFVQYYSRHEQLGSALLLLKECKATHGATPSEAYVSDLRYLCKRKEVEDLVGLIEMVGKDPNEWLRYGQKYLKRESSRKGRRNIQQAQNRLL